MERTSRTKVKVDFLSDLKLNKALADRFITDITSISKDNIFGRPNQLAFFNFGLILNNGWIEF